MLVLQISVKWKRPLDTSQFGNYENAWHFVYIQPLSLWIMIIIYRLNCKETQICIGTKCLTMALKLCITYILPLVSSHLSCFGPLMSLKFEPQSIFNESKFWAMFCFRWVQTLSYYIPSVSVFHALLCDTRPCYTIFSTLEAPYLIQ